MWIMESYQHLTYAQYLLLSSNEVMSCDAEPASAPDPRSPRVFYFSHFRAKHLFCQVFIASGAGGQHVMLHKLRDKKL